MKDRAFLRRAAGATLVGPRSARAKSSSVRITLRPTQNELFHCLAA